MRLLMLVDNHIPIGIPLLIKGQNKMTEKHLYNYPPDTYNYRKRKYFKYQVLLARLTIRPVGRFCTSKNI